MLLLTCVGIVLHSEINFLPFALLCLACCLGPPLFASEPQPQEPSPLQPAEEQAVWWSEVQTRISVLEYCWQYQATPWPGKPRAWQAPNRAHNIRTFLLPGGFRIIPRTGGTDAWEWGLALTGRAFEGAQASEDDYDYCVDGPRFERFSGGISEWYINDERGMEFGFTIDEPLERDAQNDACFTTSTMVLEMAVIGTLKPVMQPGGVVEFQKSEGEAVMLLGGLQACDATGRELPTRLKLVECKRVHSGFAVQVIVDVANAFYPITIDPLAQLAQKSAVSSEQTNTMLQFNSRLMCNFAGNRRSTDGINAFAG